MKSSDFKKRNEKDVLIIKNIIQEPCCTDTLVLQSSCANYTAFSDLNKNGRKLGHWEEMLYQIV